MPNLYAQLERRERVIHETHDLVVHNNKFWLTCLLADVAAVLFWWR